MKKSMSFLAIAIFVTAGCASNVNSNTGKKHDVHTDNRSVPTNQGSNNPVLNIEGSLTGYNSQEYIFKANANQVLRVVRENTSDNVVLTLQYLGTNTNIEALSGDFQVLPYTGEYKLVVSQTRNDARNNPKAEIKFNLKAYVTDQQNNSNQHNDVVNYKCDNNKTLDVTYRFANKDSSATVSYENTLQLLKFDPQYSKQNNPVFSNSRYMLSIGTVKEGVFGDSTVYSLIDLQQSKDGYLLLQNCQKI